MNDSQPLRRFAWCLPKEDGTNEFGFMHPALNENEWMEFERIIGVIAELRPYVLDFLGFQTSCDELAQLEGMISAELSAIPRQLSYLQSPALIRHHAEVQRRTTSFLASASAFRQRAERRLEEQHGKGSTEVVAFDIAKRNEYGTSLAYRLLYNLRNYSEHHAAPLNVVPVSGVRSPGSEHMTFTIKLQVDCKQLANYRRTQAPVRRELASMPDVAIDLMPLAGEYHRSLGRLLRVVLSLQASRLEEAFRYWKVIRSARGMPTGAIPMVWEGDLPTNVGAGQEWKGRSTLFSFDELNLFGKLVHLLRERDPDFAEFAKHGPEPHPDSGPRP